MTRLEKLIKEFCQSGVKYEKIGNAVEYEQPAKYIVTSTDYNDCEGTPVLTAGQTFILGYTNEKDGIYAASKEKPVIIFDDFTGAFKWVNFPFKVKSSAMKMLTAKKDVAILRYIYHCMGHLDFSSSEHKRLWIGIYSEFQIPVPPIPVQEEIVRILDSFTELTARKKQYEYYCNEFLDIKKTDVVFKTLGELSKFRRGSFPQPYGNAEWYDGEGAMPFVQVADIGEDMRLVADTKRKISTIAQPKSVFASSGSIIISLQGSIGRIAVTQYDAYIDRTVAIFQDISKEILPKYFVYQLQRIFAIKEKTARGSTIKTITKEEFAPFSIAVPPIDEQQRIVDVLDKFHNLCHDISEGLPAEIEARKKQYEFYRDKLLSFKETPTYEQKKEISKTE